MKTDRVLMADWSAEGHADYHDIPWPQVHAAIGLEVIAWINCCDHTQAQLILEQHVGQHQLWAEFYTSAERAEFALRFSR